MYRVRKCIDHRRVFEGKGFLTRQKRLGRYVSKQSNFGSSESVVEQEDLKNSFVCWRNVCDFASSIDTIGSIFQAWVADARFRPSLALLERYDCNTLIRL